MIDIEERIRLIWKKYTRDGYSCNILFDYSPHGLITIDIASSVDECLYNTIHIGENIVQSKTGFIRIDDLPKIRQTAKLLKELIING